MITKLEFILAQMSKARNKSYEAYVVNRMWTRLNSDEIKMICQQHITRPEGRALTDIYYPQIGVHIEIDEAHHLNQIEADAQRTADIIDATSHEIWRIPIIKDGSVIELNALNSLIDHFADEVLLRIKKAKSNRTFKPWNLEEHTTQYWIDKGQIELTDDCSFHYNHEAANCFGLNLNKGSIWTGGRSLPHPHKYIWFPKLYQNGKWLNEVIDDTIVERYIEDGLPVQHPGFDAIIKDPKQNERIVFAHVKDNLGSVAYRFKGLFKLDVEESTKQKELIWKRQNTSVTTSSYSA